jgi:hypothetical protein
MSKKRLNLDQISNELRGASAYFPKPSSESTAPSIIVQEDKLETEQANTNASTLSKEQATLIDQIRKVVKTVGREVSFVRLTPDEKQQLADIMYSFKRRGIKTSENEINRIAVNFMLKDYQANGNSSILARVIDALLA